MGTLFFMKLSDVSHTPNQFSFEQCLHKINFWKDNWQLVSILKHNMHHIFNALIPLLENKAGLEAAVCQYWPEWVIRCSSIRGIKHHLRVRGCEVKWLPMEVASSRSKAETKESSQVIPSKREYEVFHTVCY